MNEEETGMRLQGKVAAITGAGRGIGRAAAELFAREGARVAVLEIDEASGRETERAIQDRGGDARWIAVDVSDAESVRAAVETIDRTWGALHVLYNNASIFLRRDDGPAADVALETWRRVLDVNLNGMFYCLKYAIPLIVRSGGGSVINTSSSAGVIGIPNCDAYTATKGATVSLTRSLAVEYGPKKVRTNCIAPAAVYTEMLRESNLDDPVFDEQAFFRVAPLGRYGTPEEIARIALFLASDESSYLNGAIVVADGGITIT
jgi:NAD(P)-dependent dehydrogenase (short-subunit alcohol dehydrogenase family)